MNLILLTFSIFTTTVIIYSSVINFFEKNLPTFLKKNFRYGKFACKENVQGIIEIPKSSFKQFYRVAVLVCTYALYEATSVYIFNREPAERLSNFLLITCGSDRIAYSSATNVYISLILLSLQSYRRFYDTHYVSIFGKNSKINISHFIMGIFHYPGAFLAIICEAPRFATTTFGATNLNLTSLSYIDIFAILLFIWAWWHQHKTTKILAGLRKNEKGKIVTSDHKLPHGDWFEYLSSPHQTAEILMYLSITILLWYNITWFFVFTWVLANQVETILLSHWWYQETFEKFPKKRKALIPFLY
ncbi:polyprenal reductase [Leptinotarsa decemlineata]|uniref:polyprenal reductase n=1 Tax=Leptinotarsa decemlineata TaxID=7539 RepID=UPI000C2526C6|nr:polyprenol reductase [Leptinotarsa decemlineata]